MTAVFRRFLPTLFSIAVFGSACAIFGEQDGGSESSLFERGSGLVPPVLQQVWEIAGATRLSPELTLSVTDYGARPNDGRSDSDAFATAISAANGAGAVIQIPPGTFLLTETLILTSGVVLRGEGPESRLEIDLGDENGFGIFGRGKASRNDWQELEFSVQRGATKLTMSDGSTVTGNAVVEFEQVNDPEAMITREAWDVDWGDGSEGELALVQSVDGNEITLSAPLISGYDRDRSARIRPLHPIRDVGIESLSIERIDTGKGNTISFQFASNVWISGVVSSVTSQAHVGLDRVRGCTVQDSVLHDATDFGDGGRAYGISLARHTTSCLVVNNTLYDLRHALVLQLGASGNVVAYNDARGSAGYEDRRPRSDLSIHGHWPQRNLFEGNVFDRVVFADWWGPSGPENTLLRNCVLDFVEVADSSHRQVLAGNIIGPGGLTVEDGIKDTTRISNAVNGSPEDAGSVPSSLWTVEVPDFLAGGPWPRIDPGVGFDACNLPASNRTRLASISTAADAQNDQVQTMESE